MRWLLITTGGNRNPGDQFIRIGVQNLIRAVDPEATFDRLDKEDENDYQNVRPFDRAVLCGMPLFWDNKASRCREVHWWKPIFRGWISKDPRKLLCLGVGTAIGDNIIDPHELVNAAEEVISRSFAVTTRDTVVAHPELIASVCPAAFAIDRSNIFQSYRLFNAMPNGAHDAHFNEAEARVWRERVPELSKQAMEQGFHFISHAMNVNDFAYTLGWPKERVLFFETPEEYLDIYGRTELYYGNRLHGALVAAVAGARVFPVGYDSRVRMLDRFVPASYRPNSAPSVLEAMNHSWPTYDTTYMLDVERSRLHSLLRQFAS